MNKRNQTRLTFTRLIALVAIVTTVAADTPGPMVELGAKALGLKVGPNLDARGIDLRGTKLVGQRLKSANFSNCDLAGVVLENCDLSGANFSGASLRNASILDCDVSGADFSNAIVNELGGGTRSRAVLSDSQLRTTKSFKEGDMSNCSIQLASGRTMDFRGMNLRGAVFCRGDFSKCQFDGSNLKDAYFGRCQFSWEELSKSVQANFRNCEFQAHFVDEVDFSNQNLIGATLSWTAPSVKMDGANIIGCSLYGGAVPNDALRKTRNYRDGHLIRITFRKMDLTGVDFTDAVITSVNFSSAKALTAEQIRSTWNFKHGRMSTVVLSPKLRHELELKPKQIE